MNHTENRRLVAILFADIVGYSKMMHDDESNALQVIEQFQSVVEDAVDLFDGRVVQKYGDGSLCLFESAVGALRCAKVMQAKFRKGKQVEVRIGIHTGDIVQRDHEIFGDGVNIAARLQSMGQAGTILFSKSIFDKTRNHKEFETQYLGKYELKNISDPVNVYALTNEGLPIPKINQLNTEISKRVDTKQSRTLSRVITVGIILLGFAGLKLWNDFTLSSRKIDQSIAVLPFYNDSQDPSNEYFCNGIMEDILTQLQKNNELKVISRTSVIPYKDQSNRPSIRTIANELNVGYILEGSVRKSGDDILVTTQLIHGNEEIQLWADRYQQKLTAQNLFDIQSNIARKISTQLRAEISPEEEELMDLPTTNTVAYDEYFRGLYYYNDRFADDANVIKAIERFQRAVELDSSFAEAHLRLAYCHDHMYFTNMDGTEQRADQAEYHYTTAFDLDPKDPEIIEGQGWYAYHIEEDLRKAQRIFSDLSEDYPNLASPLNGLGVVSTRLGQWADAEENFKESIDLDPKYLSTHLNYYYNLKAQRKFVEAKNYIDNILNISPENTRAHEEMTNLYLLLKADAGEAIRYLEGSKVQVPNQMRYLKLMDRQFDELLEEAENTENWNHWSAYDYALAAYFAGDMAKSRQYSTTAAGLFENYLQSAGNHHFARASLGVMYALQGDAEKAMTTSNSALEAKPSEEDALLGPQLELLNARTLILLGEEDKCMDSLTQLMNQPSYVTAPLLDIDPFWEPLKDNASFNDLKAFQTEIRNQQVEFD